MQKENDIIAPQSTSEEVIYQAKVSQSGTNAPTTIIVKNTLAVTPIWHREQNGEYYASFTGYSDINKIFCRISPSRLSGEKSLQSDMVYFNGEMRAWIYSKDKDGRVSDGLLMDDIFEIVVNQ